MMRRLRYRLLIILQLFLVYISWGTTYLGYQLTLTVTGPFFACGFRMFFAGVLLWLFCLLFGPWEKLHFGHWKHAFLYGIFLVVMASGFLCYGQQYVASGVASIICGSTPITMLLASWLFADGARPNPIQFLGLAGGFSALVLLALEQNTGGSGTDITGAGAPLGMIWILLATFGWVYGSLLLRKSQRKQVLPPFQDCALLFLAGGIECFALGLLLGEHHAFMFENITIAATAAFAWMVIGGTIIAYSSYFWLLRHVNLSLAISYEYVVPVIAIFLGWWLLDEVISQRMIFSACLAVCSIFLVIHHRHAS